MTISRGDSVEEVPSVLFLDGRDFSPDDISLVYAAKGILTTGTGRTGHIAVICRGLRKPALDLGAVVVNEGRRTLTVSGGGVIHEGDAVFLDGSTGSLEYGGQAELVPVYRVGELSSDDLEFIVREVKAVSGASNFGLLPIDAQMHVARLVAALRKREEVR